MLGNGLFLTVLRRPCSARDSIGCQPWFGCAQGKYFNPCTISLILIICGVGQISKCGQVNDSIDFANDFHPPGPVDGFCGAVQTL